MKMARDSSNSCKNIFMVKLTIIAVAVGVAIFVLVDKEIWVSAEAVASLFPESKLDAKTQGSKEKSDLFKGRWVKTLSEPFYTNNTCNFIDVGTDCLNNGRPDTEYLYWRWKPYDCELSSLDARKFMNSMRHKSWAFMGASIVRNQMQSLLCILSKVEDPYLTYYDETFLFVRFYFPSYNMTIASFWAPFLVKYDTKENNEYNVYLDTLEENWTQNYTKFDYIIIGSGQWYLKYFITWENGKITGCHNCVEGYKETGIESVYRKALRMTFDFILSSDHKPVIFFRTWAPYHAEYQLLFYGGICNKTRPYDEDEYDGKLLEHVMRKTEIEEFEKAVSIASRKGILLELFDTYHLLSLRADGHPGAYKINHPFDIGKTRPVEYDCFHWCLPGPIDTLNHLIMVKILKNIESKRSSFEHEFVI